MTQEKPKIRLYVPGGYTNGATLELGRAQAHYVANVMRGDVGDAVLVFNGQDGEWLAIIEVIGKRNVTLILQEQTRAQQPSPDLWLVFAPIKSKTDQVAEKATELGVSKLIPALTRHSVVKTLNREKLEANIIEAAEQCERLDLPALENMEDLSHILAQWPQERTLLFADESGKGTPFKDMLPQLPAAPLAVLVGPEGGFSKEEQALLASKPFVKSFTMGPRILRADTASVAALACVQAWLGDWQEKPNFKARA